MITHVDWIETEMEDDLVICTITKESLFHEEDVQGFGACLFSLYHAGCRKFVIDMSNLQLMSLEAIGKLVTLSTWLTKDRMELVLCNMSPEVNKIFISMLHLGEFFLILSARNNAEAYWLNAATK